MASDETARYDGLRELGFCVCSATGFSQLGTHRDKHKHSEEDRRGIVSIGSQIRTNQRSVNRTSGAKIRLMLACHSLYGGGAERACYLLANYLAEDLSNRVSLVLFKRGGAYVREVSSTVSTISTPFPLARFGIIGYRGFLAWSLRQFRPAVLLSFAEWPNAVAGTARLWSRDLDLKVIGFEQNVRTFINCPSDYGVSDQVAAAARASYERLDRLICSSRAVEASVKKAISKPPMRVIPNPVDLRTVHRLAAEDVEVSFDSDKKHFAAVGRFHEQKDYPTMLRAFNEAYSVDKRIELHILGTGALESSIKALASSLPCNKAIRFHGFMANPFPVMARCDALLHSAVYEGFGNVFVESLAVGTPVITTDCDTPAEIFGNDCLGRRVAVGDVQGLARLILSQRKKESELSEKCVMRAADFDIAKYAGAVLAECRSLLNLGTD